MHPEDQFLLKRTRRQLFRDCGFGIGKAALASVMADNLLAQVNARHHAPKVDRVIFLFMAGAPTQLELFDYKPELVKWDGKVTPESFLKGKRFAFMDTFAKEPPKLLGTRRQFKQAGGNGMWFSELVPNLATVADDIAMIPGYIAKTERRLKHYLDTGLFALLD